MVWRKLAQALLESFTYRSIRHANQPETRGRQYVVAVGERRYFGSAGLFGALLPLDCEPGELCRHLGHFGLLFYLLNRKSGTPAFSFYL